MSGVAHPSNKHRTLAAENGVWSKREISGSLQKSVAAPLQGRAVGLDALRGVAALLVLVNHARAFALQNANELVHPGVLLKAFYFVTGIGHQAVVIFFALSGFLVGGKALADFMLKRFSWPEYLLRRMTRLWVVVIPALIATFLLDSLGQSITNGTGYDGSLYDLFSSGPDKATRTDLSLTTLVGNLAFLQTVAVPIYGSNGPMWSLANEFWYYIFFPMAIWIVASHERVLRRAPFVIALAAMVVFLPSSLREGGLVWMAGAAASQCSRLPGLQAFWKSIAVRIAASAFFLLMLILSKSWSTTSTDLLLGIAVALALPMLANIPNPGGVLSRLSRASSEISYTLYLTHFPLLTLIAFCLFEPERSAPDVYGLAVFLSLTLVALLWASVLWFSFERQTDRLYRTVVSSRLWLTFKSKGA